ncbi:MAG: ImmA/IrrE family metallo-endopeptidase [Thermodesulfobacteriota bacterium]
MGGDWLRIRVAQKLAEDLLAEWGWDSLPVDPFSIAAKHDIVIEPKPSPEPGSSGFLMRVGDVFGIMYANHVNNDGYRRFTVAHELGHYFLPGHPDKLFPHGDGLHQSRSGFVSRDPTEIDADYFAASLLMPTGLFRAAMRSAGEGLPAIEALASLCRTSLTATAIRYAQKWDDAVAVIVSEGDRVSYCFLSEDFRALVGREWLAPGTLLPRDTRTYHFNCDPANVRESRRAEDGTTLWHWFGKGRMELNEDVVGLGTYGRTLTMLFPDSGQED